MSEQLLSPKFAAKYPDPSNWDPAYRDLRQRMGKYNSKAKYSLQDLPAGYVQYLNVTTYAGKASSNRRDHYLYGWSLGKVRYRSPNEFIPHLLWLITNPYHAFYQCQCKQCPIKYKEWFNQESRFDVLSEHRVNEIVWIPAKVAVCKKKSSPDWSWKVTHEIQPAESSLVHTVSAYRDIKYWPAVIKNVSVRFDLNSDLDKRQSEFDGRSSHRWSARFQDKVEFLEVPQQPTGGVVHQRVKELTEDLIVPYLALSCVVADENFLRVAAESPDSKALAASQILVSYSKALEYVTGMRKKYWLDKDDSTAVDNHQRFHMAQRSLEAIKATCQFELPKEYKHVAGVQYGTDYVGLGDSVRLRVSENIAKEIFDDQKHLDQEYRDYRALEVLFIAVDNAEQVVFFGIPHRILAAGPTKAEAAFKLGPTILQGYDSYPAKFTQSNQEVTLVCVPLQVVKGRFFQSYPLITESMCLESNPELVNASEARNAIIEPKEQVYQTIADEVKTVANAKRSIIDAPKQISEAVKRFKTLGTSFERIDSEELPAVSDEIAMKK